MASGRRPRGPASAGGGKPAPDDLRVEAPAGGARLGVQVPAQGLAQARVLAPGQVGLAARAQGPHQPGVGLLVGRLGVQGPAQDVDRQEVLPPRLVQAGQLHEQPDVDRPQALPALGGPVLVAVLGEQLAGVEGDGRPVAGGVVRPGGGPAAASKASTSTHRGPSG